MRYVRLLLAYCAGLAFACSSYGQSQPPEPEKPVETTVSTGRPLQEIRRKASAVPCLCYQ